MQQKSPKRKATEEPKNAFKNTSGSALISHITSLRRKSFSCEGWLKEKWKGGKMAKIQTLAKMWRQRLLKDLNNKVKMECQVHHTLIWQTGLKQVWNSF